MRPTLARTSAACLVLAAAAAAERPAAEPRARSVALGRAHADLFCPPADAPGARRPRLAVLLAGDAAHLERTHASIVRYAVDALGADARLFAALRGGAPGGARTLAVLAPASLAASGAAAGGSVTSDAAACAAPPLFRAAYAACVAYERETGWRADAFVALRSDAAWLAPLPPWCAYDAWAAQGRAYYGAGRRGDGNASTHGVDWMLVPRDADVFLPLRCGEGLDDAARRLVGRAGSAVRLRDLPTASAAAAAAGPCDHVPQYLRFDDACNVARTGPAARRADGRKDARRGERRP
ncbi:hypothetical protein M885DRAFT_545673 [Pelagophyceae sp. CCMP2097]|nr:hypothetical protein M885DRAFT_545673 [Pelagophyceae sp. CCMP2097]